MYLPTNTSKQWLLRVRICQVSSVVYRILQGWSSHQGKQKLETSEAPLPSVFGDKPAAREKEKKSLEAGYSVQWTEKENHQAFENEAEAVILIVTALVERAGSHHLRCKG